MLLGLAIGDALGITTEGLTPARRKEYYEEIRDDIPNRYVNEARGFPSDDTKDNDTIAAIVGAAVGALHGKEALP